MTLGIVTVRGGLTLPGMVPAGDSAGAGVASMQAGAVLGTAAIGAAVTGEVAAIGDTITTIIITRTTTDRRGVQCQAVILPEEVLPVAIALHHQTVRHLTDHRIVQLL